MTLEKNKIDKCEFDDYSQLPNICPLFLQNLSGLKLEYIMVGDLCYDSQQSSDYRS